MKQNGYVVCGVEHLQDGQEFFARRFARQSAALEWINQMAAGLLGGACTFQLFELGAEVPLESADVTTPQPAKVTRGFRFKEGTP